MKHSLMYTVELRFKSPLCLDTFILYARTRFWNVDIEHGIVIMFMLLILGAWPMLDFCGQSCFCSLKASDIYIWYRYFQFVSPALYLTSKTLLYITKWHISDNIYTNANIGGMFFSSVIKMIFLAMICYLCCKQQLPL